MTNQQYATAILTLKQDQNSDLDKVLTSTIESFQIPESEFDFVKELLLDDFRNGIMILNKNQFDNILKMVKDDGLLENDILKKLDFYEISLENQKHILKFLKSYSSVNNALKVHHLDENFKGIQVATSDDFNMLLGQGYSGDWVVDPKNVKHKRLQIASMNETGSFPRGYFINANIERFEPIQYEDKIRYRIHFSNPKIINSGNRNIKFNSNPVKYIH